MALTPEGIVKKAVKQILKDRGIWYFMPQNVGMGVSGVPDFICCLPSEHGKLLAIECKAKGKRGNTTALQDIQIAAIKAAQGWAIVIDAPSQLLEYLDDRSARAQSPCRQGDKPGADTSLPS